MPSRRVHNMAIVDERLMDSDLLGDAGGFTGEPWVVPGGCVSPTFYGDGEYPPIVATVDGLAVGVYVRFLPLEPLDPPEDEDDE